MTTKTVDLTYTVVALREVLRKLTPIEYEVMRRYFIDETPMALIARRMRIPRKQVRMLIAKVRRTLKEHACA